MAIDDWRLGHSALGEQMDADEFKQRTKALAIRMIRMVPTSRLGDLTRETQEILAMTVASKRTLRRAQIENRKSKIENPNAPA